MFSQRTIIFLLLSILPATYSQANESRVALVIGNGAYINGPLKNPGNDAHDMSAKLRGLGFDVIERNNIKMRQIGSTLSEFRSKLSPGAVALVFYAGHGIQIKGENYLPSVDADINSEEDVPNQSVSVKQIMDVLDESKTRLNLVFLDACRNNPFSRSFRSAEGGLARVSAPSGTLISYATRPGSVAADGDGRNGLYTSKLLKQLSSSQQIEQSLKAVVSEVKAASLGKQEPWMEGSIEGDFCFAGCGLNIPPPQQESLSPGLDSNAMEVSFWESIKNSNNPEDFRAYLEQYPNGGFVALARNRLKTPVPVAVRPELTPAPITEQPDKAALSIGSPGPAGGIVFYVDNTGAHGLEAQLADYTKQPGDYGSNGQYTWPHAGDAAGSYGSGWRLPTKDELNQLYLKTTVVGGFAEFSILYWSSTEASSDDAWWQNRYDGEQGHGSKYSLGRVRAVRAF